MFWIFFSLFSVFNTVNSLCTLPQIWSGKWYMSKETDLMTIDKTTFVNKGVCIENVEDKFLFYESDECYRCIFVMQKHQNVLQYRASYCSEQSDFNTNCENLSPESELITIYRDNAISEKCPLNGMYVLTNKNDESSLNDVNSDDRAYRSSSNLNANCVENSSNKNSMIMECSDHTMLKLQFGKCTSVPTFIVNCVAHWTEGNINYLIGRLSSDETNQKPTYKCLSYSEIPNSNSNQESSFHSIGNDQKYAKHMRRQPQQSQFDFVDFLSNHREPVIEQSNIQLSVSQDEFCRNIDNMIDEQYSFTFNKIQDSLHVSPTSLKAINANNRSRFRRQSSFNTSESYALLKNTYPSRSHVFKPSGSIYHTCKFPRWLNKKWHNLKQTKMFTIDYKLDSLLVLDQKSSVIINKYTCSHMRARKASYVQAIVKTLNGCSSGYQCLTISSKSDFVLEIKFGKIHYENNLVGICDSQNESAISVENGIVQEFVYVDTNYGVDCPLNNGIYEKLNTKSNAYRSLNNFDQSLNDVDHDGDEEEPCKYLTQTQTLQIGCQSDQQYSLRTKLCYPNHQYNKPISPSSSIQKDDDLSSFNVIIENTNHMNSPKPTTSTSTYTQLESEINLVCLAHWKHNGNHVIVSRTMTNEVLCSIWSSSPDGKFLKLLEIDSNCNYDKKDMNQNQINYGFVFKRSCNVQAKPSLSSYSIANVGGVGGVSSLFASSMTVSSSATCSFRLSTFYSVLILLFFVQFSIPKS